MIFYSLALILGAFCAFLLGSIYRGKRAKRDSELAIMIIENLKATIKIYKATNEQQKKYYESKIESKNDEIQKLLKHK